MATVWLVEVGTTTGVGSLTSVTVCMCVGVCGRTCQSTVHTHVPTAACRMKWTVWRTLTYALCNAWFLSLKVVAIAMATTIDELLTLSRGWVVEVSCDCCLTWPHSIGECAETVSRTSWKENWKKGLTITVASYIPWKLVLLKAVKAQATKTSSCTWCSFSYVTVMCRNQSSFHTVYFSDIKIKCCITDA